MKKTQKRAFILSECKSPYIQQAIFILKDGFDCESKSVIADAERIVAAYMGNQGSLEKKKTAQPALLLSFILAGLAIAAAAVILSII